MALEVGRQVQVAQIVVTGEGDPEHLVGLALVPVRAGVDRYPAVDDGVVVRNVGLQRDAEVLLQVGDSGEHLHPRVATGNTGTGAGVPFRRRLRRIVFAPSVRTWAPVDGRKEAEVVAADDVASAMPAARQAAPLTRIQRSSPGLTTLSTTPFPSESR